MTRSPRYIAPRYEKKKKKILWMYPAGASRDPIHRRGAEVTTGHRKKCKLLYAAVQILPLLTFASTLTNKLPGGGNNQATNTSKPCEPILHTLMVQNTDLAIMGFFLSTELLITVNCFSSLDVVKL